MNRNGNFCKRAQVGKIIAGVKVDAHVVQQKKSTGFSRMSVMANLLRFLVLFCGITCKWVLFSIIDLYFYWLA